MKVEQPPIVHGRHCAQQAVASSVPTLWQCLCMRALPWLYLSGPVPVPAPQSMLDGMDPRELRSLPPFPFPKEMFPPGGVRGGRGQ